MCQAQGKVLELKETGCVGEAHIPAIKVPRGCPKLWLEPDPVFIIMFLLINSTCGQAEFMN